MQAPRVVDRGDALDDLRQHEVEAHDAVGRDARPGRGGAVAPEVVEDASTLDDLHGEVRLVAVDEELVQLDQVGVRQPRERAKLFLQVIEVVAAGAAHGLERDHARRLVVVRAIHDPHAASAEDLDGTESRRDREGHPPR